jgi:hypothetical protein
MYVGIILESDCSYSEYHSITLVAEMSATGVDQSYEFPVFDCILYFQDYPRKP